MGLRAHQIFWEDEHGIQPDVEEATGRREIEEPGKVSRARRREIVVDDARDRGEIRVLEVEVEKEAGAEARVG